MPNTFADIHLCKILSWSIVYVKLSVKLRLEVSVYLMIDGFIDHRLDMIGAALKLGQKLKLCHSVSVSVLALHMTLCSTVLLGIRL